MLNSRLTEIVPLVGDAPMSGSLTRLDQADLWKNNQATGEAARLSDRREEVLSLISRLVFISVTRQLSFFIKWARKSDVAASAGKNDSSANSDNSATLGGTPS
jgi:hypothetical protein